jgi:transcriptional regulator with XRE-family HTH domain
MATLDMGLFAARLRTARQRRGLTQRGLAARAGVHLGNLNELEGGHRDEVYATTLVALADALQVTTDYLLGRSEDPTPPKRPRPRKTAPVG